MGNESQTTQVRLGFKAFVAVPEMLGSMRCNRDNGLVEHHLRSRIIRSWFGGRSAEGCTNSTGISNKISLLRQLQIDQ